MVRHLPGPLGWILVVLAAALSTSPLLASGVGAEPYEAWIKVVQRHWDRFPEAAAQDVYVLLDQATRGVRLSFLDEQAAREWLLRDLRRLEADPTQPLIEWLDPDHQMARVHLRPFLALGGSAERLFRALVECGQSELPVQPGFPELLAYFAEADLGSKSRERLLRSFIRLMKSKDYPPLPHSDRFRELYEPEYRVLPARLLPALGILDPSSRRQGDGP